MGHSGASEEPQALFFFWGGGQAPGPPVMDFSRFCDHKLPMSQSWLRHWQAHSLEMSALTALHAVPTAR